MKSSVKLYPGDLIQVRSPGEILETLDDNGTLGNLPFMPEMLAFCGQRFRVFRRVVKTCISGTSSTMLAFDADDVVLLEGLRCSGAAHDGCEKSCIIFWREAWLSKVSENGGARTLSSTSGSQDGDPVRDDDAPSGDDSAQLRARLKTVTRPNVYFCQASELPRAARQLSRAERFTKCFGEVAAGNCTALQMAARVGTWIYWRLRRIIFGAFGRGTHTSTPAETLRLQAGELVQVKTIQGIARTLNDRSYNRGLWFSPEMRLICGTEQQVERRIDKLIVDGTGEMRRLRDTVFLKGSMCGCAHVAFGGCSRCEFNYWREIWLQRPGASR